MLSQFTVHSSALVARGLLSAFFRVVEEPTLTGSSADKKAGARLVVANFFAQRIFRHFWKIAAPKKCCGD